MQSLFDTSLTWKDLDWLCGTTQLPVWVKGVVRPDDALKAIEHGAKGIVVSNHGGRQLDTAPATIEVLPEIAQVVENQAEILVDGGIRRGTDIIKAVALGAKAVGIGRPVLWGLTVNGSEGVSEVLEILRKEVELGLGLCGVPNLSELGPDLIFG